MAAIFSNRIVDAFYTNPELDTIEVVYAQVAPGEDMTGVDVERLGAFDVKTRPVSHWVKADPDDWQYQELIKEISIERIDNRTIENNQGNRIRFVESFQRYAAEQGWSQNPQVPAELVTSSLDDLIFNFDESHQESKEELFKLKLALFEKDAVKNSDDKKVKADIRKATTPLEVLSIYYSLLPKN